MTSSAQVADVDITILHEPKGAEPTVEYVMISLFLFSLAKDNRDGDSIVFVHGLQGHPQKTWLYEGKASRPRSVSPSPSTTGKKKSKLRGIFRKKREAALTVSSDGDSAHDHNVYWPQDLLPIDCPNARIMTRGYDSVVTKGYKLATSQNALYDHAKNLLNALTRERASGSPLIFVAHSLGGIITKEALRRSEDSEDDDFKDVFLSTCAVVFLGTPHRGSENFANVGELARRIVSVLGADTSPVLLRALGIDSPELELGRESFVRQWRQRNFAVKTFQEDRALAGVNFGLLNEKVVPKSSSLLDDPREHAETLDADHINMCKMSGREDTKYKKVSSELQRLVKNIAIKQSTIDSRPKGKAIPVVE